MPSKKPILHDKFRLVAREICALGDYDRIAEGIKLWKSAAVEAGLVQNAREAALAAAGHFSIEGGADWIFEGHPLYPAITGAPTPPAPR